MLDYISSKNAYGEHEERVRSHVPELVYDGWARRQQATGKPGRLVQIVSAVEGGLTVVIEWVTSRDAIRYDSSSAHSKINTLPEISLPTDSR